MENRWMFPLAIAAVAIGVLFGLPPVLVILKGAPSAVLVFVFVLAVIFVLLGGFLYWLFKAPAWTVERAEYIVTIQDDQGRATRVRKNLTVRSNRTRQNQRFTHRNIGADGGGNMKWTVDPSVTQAGTQLEVGHLVVHVDLKSSISFLQRDTHWIELDFVDALTKPKEAFFIVVSEPTREVTLTIMFPATRRPTSAWANYQSSGDSSRLTDPVIKDGEIRWTCRRRFPTLRRGEYQVWWTW